MSISCISIADRPKGGHGSGLSQERSTRKEDDQRRALAV